MIAAPDFTKLRNYMMFHDVAEDALKELAAHCQVIELQAGKTLFEQNDASNALYMLEDGQIHIIRQYPDGDEVILATEGPYYVIGDLSMLVEQGRTGAVVAVSDCTLIKLDREAFDDVCSRRPNISANVVAYLAKRLYRMNLLVREQAVGNMKARLASLLMLLSGRDEGTMNTAIRVNRIARATAIDADKVEHILHEWDRAGYISYDGRQVIIHNIDRIRDQAG
ncbi:MAG: Crp/Fnr family transcriptional regulator [Anaerolineae bacterium]|nr:Crp/Fnr family transcriptional regulator [Anaerolineae bacterium]